MGSITYNKRKVPSYCDSCGSKAHIYDGICLACGEIRNKRGFKDPNHSDTIQVKPKLGKSLVSIDASNQLVKAHLSDLGIVTTDSQGHAKGFIEVLSNIRKVWDQLDDSEQFMLLNSMGLINKKYKS
ncbi:ribosomal protein L37E [Virgibacillus halotolerans]|nr:ribosomal protein L37E [Virgibacillus halotolerans]